MIDETNKCQLIFSKRIQVLVIDTDAVGTEDMDRRRFNFLKQITIFVIEMIGIEHGDK